MGELYKSAQWKHHKSKAALSRQPTKVKGDGRQSIQNQTGGMDVGVQELVGLGHFFAVTDKRLVKTQGLESPIMIIIYYRNKKFELETFTYFAHC